MRFASRSDEIRSFEPLCEHAVNGFYAPGLDRDDLMQEARIAVNVALDGYRLDAGASKRTFVQMVVERRLGTAVKTAKRQKHAALNDAVTQVRDSDGSYVDALSTVGEDPGADVVDLLAARERLHNAAEVAQGQLSDLEREALGRFLSGDDYEYIAERVGATAKTVDNALQRAKRKLEQAPDGAWLSKAAHPRDEDWRWPDDAPFVPRKPGNIRRVCELRVEGATMVEIAQACAMSQSTVATYLRIAAPHMAMRRSGGGKPAGVHARLSDDEFRALHREHARSGTSVRALAAREWEAAGYASPESCASQIAFAWRRLGLGNVTFARQGQRVDFERRCDGIVSQGKNRGARCARHRMEGSGFCAVHDPLRKGEVMRAIAVMHAKSQPTNYGRQPVAA